MAGGDTEVGGNGSVYWRARHFGKDQAKRRFRWRSRGQRHKNDEIDVDNDEALGCDEDTPATDVGNRLGHKGSFMVTLRYGSREDAQAALDQAQITGTGPFFVKVLCPSITRTNPTEDPPFEVKVEW